MRWGGLQIRAQLVRQAGVRLWVGGRDSGKADGWMRKPHGLEPRAPFWGGNFAFWLIHRFQEVGSLMFSN